jgi:tetratricopeptide (TPR) repeat protein
MYRSSWFLTAALMGLNVALVQQVAVAKSSIEVGEIAAAITVEIKSANTSKVGSGILLQQQGNVYTVLTAAHVVTGSNELRLKTADGAMHSSLPGSVRRAGSNIDLAILKFRSSKSYALAKVGTSNSLKLGSLVYVAGFPQETEAIAAGVLNFTDGKVRGKATQGNQNGYSLIYGNDTLPGMSGGPVLNEEGELVAIHGLGDRDGARREKTGRNLGIVVEQFGAAAISMGVQLDQQVVALPRSQAFNATDYFLKGNEKYDLEDYAGAMADYNQAIALDPNYAFAYVSRGTLKYVKLNDLSGALIDYNRAIAADPKGADAFYSRGSLKEKLNDPTGAMSDYNRAITLDPNYANAYNNRGILKENLNDLTGAMADYNQSIVINPKDAIAYLNRGSLKENKLNDPQGALADYNQSILLDPKYTKAYNNRASLKQDMNDATGALADYNRAIALDPNYAIAYSNRGSLKQEKLNDLNGALADYSKAIALNPQYAKAYYNRGSVKNKLNDPTGAIADYNQAITIDPKYAYAYHNRGFVKQSLNNISGAIQDFRQAAKLYRAEGQTKYLQQMIEQLRDLGATE